MSSRQHCRLYRKELTGWALNGTMEFFLQLKHFESTVMDSLLAPFKSNTRTKMGIQFGKTNMAMKGNAH